MMKEFLFIYRTDYAYMSQQSPEQMQAMMQKWMDWLGGIAARDQLITKGNRLHNTGKVVKSKGIALDGPYTELKETVGGYSIVRAAGYEEAVTMAEGCPILGTGGAVEIREINQL